MTPSTLVRLFQNASEAISPKRRTETVKFPPAWGRERDGNQFLVRGAVCLADGHSGALLLKCESEQHAMELVELLGKTEGDLVAGFRFKGELK